MADQNCDGMSPYHIILRDESQTVGNSPMRSSSLTLNLINQRLIQWKGVYIVLIECTRSYEMIGHKGFIDSVKFIDVQLKK